MQPTDLPTNCTLAIWNTFPAGSPPVTVYLTDITPTYIYNVTINSLTNGLGSNVIIDGSTRTFTPGSDITIFKGPRGNGFIQLNDANAALTGIEIKNITFTITSQDIYTADNSGWICAGGTSKANVVACTTCSVASTSALNIGAYNNNGGICGGQNGAGGLYTFTTCSVTSTALLTIDRQNSGGICGGKNGAGTFTFIKCSIISMIGVNCNLLLYPVGTYHYIAFAADPATTPPTIANNFLLFGDTQAGVYSSNNLLMVAPSKTNIFPPATTTNSNNNFTGYNLTGTDLSNVDLSNYDLTGTNLTGVNLLGVVFNANTKITDSSAIATHIVQNSGVQVDNNNVYTVPADVLTQYGMSALNNGLTTAGKQTLGMSLFASGLFTALINSTTVGMLPDTQVLLPAASLPPVQPWLTFPAGSTVQLLNASVYPITALIDLTTLNSSTTFFYTLVQNYPDTVTVKNGLDTLVTTAIAPYNPDPTQVSFTCVTTVDGLSTTVIKKAGDPTPLPFAGRNFYVGSLSFGKPASTRTNTYNISPICFPAGTPIKTDQGLVPIEQIDTRRHTLCGQPILHITKTISPDKYLIRIEKNALRNHYPTQTTVISKDHKIMFQDHLIPASRFLTYGNKVTKVKYSGEVLYNVLLAYHGTMLVNNLVCETLNPYSAIAKLYMNTSAAVANHASR